jgi:plastocyanin
VRKFIIAGVLGLVLTLAPAGTAVSTATKAVKITRTGFVPTKTTVKVGDSVKWTNSDTITHQVVADNGSFASPVLGAGKSYIFRFRASGTYRYHDGLHPSLKGTVVVTGPPPAVSIGASQPIIVYGQQPVLSGVVSNHLDGETVTVYQQPYPQASFSQLTKVITTSGGAWSLVVKPTLLTSFEAKWKSSTSVSVGIQVRPKMGFTHQGRLFYTRATAATDFTGKRVFVQRLTHFGDWVKIRKLTLGTKGFKQFRMPHLPKGVSRLRVFMSLNQAGPGYLDGFSSVLTIRR